MFFYRDKQQLEQMESSELRHNVGDLYDTGLHYFELWEQERRSSLLSNAVSLLAPYLVSFYYLFSLLRSDSFLESAIAYLFSCIGAAGISLIGYAAACVLVHGFKNFFLKHFHEPTGTAHRVLIGILCALLSPLALAVIVFVLSNSGP